jgi:multicomponent Na+:H+ antiporter subunit A
MTGLTALAVLSPLILGLLAAPAVALAGTLRPSYAAPVGTAFAALTALSVALGWSAGGGVVNVAWVPTWDLRFVVALDGLAALYALLATGIGFLVLLYSSRYLPLHLEHEGRPPSAATGFYFFVLLFMGSMVGLAMAQDLVLLFVFWDLTAVASYFLIGFDVHKEESRASALMALLVTGITAVFLLIGAVFLYANYGTFSVPELAREVDPGPLLTTCGLLIAVSGLAKSAQAPLHFWLPRAMAAPTPVSAYLHSAAMVAAGVLLIGRVYPLLQKSDVVLGVLLVVGLLSMAVGGILALTRDVLKQLLAYSTIAQYGFVVTMYGLAGPYGAGGAAYYVIAHAVAKSALFLTAGAVTEATGEDRLSGLGGLARTMPLLAVSSGLAAATLTSLPLTLGFFADEFFFAAALGRGPLFAALAVACAAVTLAYTWRFWGGIFLGETFSAPHRVPRLLVAPVAVLGLVGLVGGFVAGPFEKLAEAAGEVSFGAPTRLDASYHLEFLPEYLMALAAYALGIALIFTRPVWSSAAAGFSRLGKRVGPERLYRLTVTGLNRLSDSVHRVEIRNLRGRVAAVLVPTALLVGAGVLATPGLGAFRVGQLWAGDAPLMLALFAVATASLAATFTRRHVTLALVLSSAGFVLAAVYAFYAAPNVALVAVLIETMLTLLLVATLRLIPYRVLHRQAELPLVGRGRKVLVSVLAGAFALVLAWGALSQPPAGQTVAAEHVQLTPRAHAGNVVTATLADFRGLDTLGEITVIALVLLGVATLLGGAVSQADGRIGGNPAGASRAPRAPAARVVTRGIARLLYLPTFLVAAALLVKGFVETGDGFSAGVVAALGVLLRYLAFGYGETKDFPPVRHATAIALSGLLVGLGVAAFPLLFGEPVLTHYPLVGTEPIHLGTVELMTAVLFDAGIFALVFGFAVGVVSAFARAIAQTEEYQGLPGEERS